jgi:N-acetyl-anhydromuramyl-L-alanine amidase AmpD
VAYPFVASPHINKADGRQIDLIVIHTMEMNEKGDTAESCAHWFQNPNAKVSAHYCVDNNSIVQCVRDQDVGWHAPGANHDGIGVEHAGRAAQTGRDWSDPYSTAMLERSATLVAELCRKYEIPPTWLYAADLKAGKRGITTHNAVSEAFKRGTHWDPGKGFPVQKYLALVQSKLKQGAPPAKPKKLKADPPTLRRGDKGWQVKRLQTLLRGQGLFPPPAKPDGVFGEITEAAVMGLQAQNDLEIDGVAGPMTWRALLRAEVKVEERALQPA